MCYLRVIIGPCFIGCYLTVLCSFSLHQSTADWTIFLKWSLYFLLYHYLFINSLILSIIPSLSPLFMSRYVLGFCDRFIQSNIILFAIFSNCLLLNSLSPIGLSIPLFPCLIVQYNLIYYHLLRTSTNNRIGVCEFPLLKYIISSWDLFWFAVVL